MHPLKKYMSNLRIASITPEEYQGQINALADKVGISSGKLVRLHYSGQSNIAPEKGMMLELATNGLVPADSVCNCLPIMDLVLRIIEMRSNNSDQGTGHGKT